MNRDLSNNRKSYTKNFINEYNMPLNPYDQFYAWYKIAEKSNKIAEANAMSLATIGLDGMPKTRVVLLKGFNLDGFVFYTNYQSEKGAAMETNPNVCLSFFWADLEQQIIIKGSVEKVSEAVSNNYFDSCPRGSQLGAWASNQSCVINNYTDLEGKLTELDHLYLQKTIPRPKHWGGYLVKPLSFEFWQGILNRLHHRIRYTKTAADWLIELLSP